MSKSATLTIDAAELAGALAGHIAKANAAVDILKHVLVRADHDGIELTSTDVEAWITTRITASASAPVTCALEAARLRAAITGLTGPVSIDIDTGKCQATLRNARGGRFQIPSLPAADFPAAHDDIHEQVQTDLEALAKAIRRVQYAKAVKDARYYLNGVHVGGGMVAATNGHRLAIVDLDAGLNAIIPSPSLGALLAAMGQDGATLRRRPGHDGRDAALGVEWPGGSVYTNLVDGRFPDARRVAVDPDTLPHHITVNPAELGVAVQRLMPFAGPYRGLVLTAADGNLQLTANAEQTSDTVPAEGDLPEIGIDGKYLLEVCRQADGAEQMRISATDAQSVVAVQFADRDDTHHLMPMRI